VENRSRFQQERARASRARSSRSLHGVDRGCVLIFQITKKLSATIAIRNVYRALAK
jgi:hypothetical protein